MKNCPGIFIMKKLNVDFMLTPEVMLPSHAIGIHKSGTGHEWPLKSYLQLGNPEIILISKFLS